MSKESALAFRDYVQKNPHVEAEIRSALLKDGAVDNTVIGKRHGFEFTIEEGNAAWADVANAGGELSDFELEMISGGGEEALMVCVEGGGKHPCNTDDSRFAQSDDLRSRDGGQLTGNGQYAQT